MLRCWMSLGFVIATAMLVGCAEETLDVPISLPGVSNEVTNDSADTVQVDTVTPKDGLEHAEPTVVEECPSAVDSIWKALLEGTAQALDESPPQP